MGRSINKEKGKPRIALFAKAVLGGGPYGQGIPVLADLFSRLSKYFDITFYCFDRIDRAVVSNGIKVRQVLPGQIAGRIRDAVLTCTFVRDHFFKPFDLIFSISIYPPGKWALLAGRLFNKPVVVQIIALEAAALPEIGYGNLMKPWLAKITRHVCERADNLVAVAEYQKQVAVKSLPTTREIDVLPLRIDSMKFPYHTRVISSPVRFIHVAFYSPVKDQHTMFKAFAKVARVIECHLTVVGGGFNVPEVHGLLKDLNIGDKVTLVGVIAQPELPSYFRDAHILLHTSRFETGCAAVQEAMASGVAVCGTEVGILADLGAKYAMLVSPGNADRLAEKILQLINDPDAYRRMTEEAYRWIANHDAVWAAENYRIFFEKIISGTQPA